MHVLRPHSPYSLDLSHAMLCLLVSCRTKNNVYPLFAIFAVKCSSIPSVPWYHSLNCSFASSSFIPDTFPDQNFVTLLFLEGSCVDWEHLTVSQPHSADPKRCTRMASPLNLGSKELWQVLLVQVLHSKELLEPVSRIRTPNSIEVLPGTAEIR